MDEPPGFQNYAAYQRTGGPGGYGSAPRRVRLDAIGDAFDLVKLDWGNWVGITLVAILIVIAIQVPFTVLIMARTDFGKAAYNRYLPPADVVAINVVATCVNLIVLGILQAGITNVAVQRLRGAQTEFGAFFDFRGRLGQLATAQLMMCPLALLPILGGYAAHAIFGAAAQNGDAVAFPFVTFGGQLVGDLLYYIVMCWLVFVPLLIVDRGLNVGEAFRESLSTAGPRVPAIFGLWIVASFVGFVGVFACGIGVLFTIPVYLVTFGVLYNDFYRPDNVPIPAPTSFEYPPPSPG
jgi:hypothetical protein